jgi:hypothetical protein
MTAQYNSSGAEMAAQCNSSGAEMTAQCNSSGAEMTAQCNSSGAEMAAQCNSSGAEMAAHYNATHSGNYPICQRSRTGHSPHLLQAVVKPLWLIRIEVLVRGLWFLRCARVLRLSVVRVLFGALRCRHCECAVVLDVFLHLYVRQLVLRHCSRRQR